MFLGGQDWGRRRAYTLAHHTCTWPAGVFSPNSEIEDGLRREMLEQNPVGENHREHLPYTRPCMRAFINNDILLGYLVPVPAVTIFLSCPYVRMLNKPLSAMPCVEDTCHIIGKSATFSVPFHQPYTCLIGVWDVRACPWTKFYLDLLIEMTNLGLDSLIEQIDDRSTHVLKY